MTYAQFAELETHYNRQYNFWTDKLDAPKVSIYAYKKIERRIMYYGQKLSELYDHANSLTYPKG